MNFYIILAIFVISTFGMFTINSTSAQVDPFIDIEFLQTGELNTSENQFHISNEITIREFFNGNIIRVSGQVIEGFPYITYSKILEDEINTHGMIFIGGEFVNLDFEEKIIQEEEIVEKNQDISIVVQYTQRIYEDNFARIDIKIYDKEQNKLNYFDQNYGLVPNTNVKILVIDDENQEYYSTNGTTDGLGLLQIEFFVPKYTVGEFIVTIDAENENSKTSKILQILSLSAPIPGSNN